MDLNDCVIHNWATQYCKLTQYTSLTLYIQHLVFVWLVLFLGSLGSGVRFSSVVRAFAHGVMGHQIDPSW